MWFWGLLFVLAAAAILFRVLGWARRGQNPGRADDGPGRQAVLGPDGTNRRPPESYVIHHEGKGEGMDAANAARLEAAEELAPRRAAELTDPDGWAPLRETGALPARYDVDEVVALPTAPHRAYVYWDLGGGGEDALPAAVRRDSRRALRVYDLTCGTLWAQVEVAETADHHWLNGLPHAGHLYAVEIGRADAGGGWHPLARSAPLRTPAPAAGPAGAGWSPGAAGTPGE